MLNQACLKLDNLTTFFQLGDSELIEIKNVLLEEGCNSAVEEIEDLLPASGVAADITECQNTVNELRDILRKIRYTTQDCWRSKQSALRLTGCGWSLQWQCAKHAEDKSKELAHLACPELRKHTSQLIELRKEEAEEQRIFAEERRRSLERDRQRRIARRTSLPTLLEDLDVYSDSESERE